MDAKEATREVYENLRENNTLRHRLGVEEGPEILDADPTVIAWTDKEGQDFFMQVALG